MALELILSPCHDISLYHYIFFAMFLNFRKVYYLRVFIKNLLLCPSPTLCYWYTGRAERGRGVVV